MIVSGVRNLCWNLKVNGFSKFPQMRKLDFSSSDGRSPSELDVAIASVHVDAWTGGVIIVLFFGLFFCLLVGFFFNCYRYFLFCKFDYFLVLAVCVCHGWFHLQGLTRAVRNASRAKITKLKILANSGMRSRNSRKCLQDLSVLDNFHDTSSISESVIKSYVFYFCVGKISRRQYRENFHVNSI